MGYVRNRDGLSVEVSIESMPMMGIINTDDDRLSPNDITDDGQTVYS